MEEINNFQQEPDETLYQAWERFKELLMKCPQHYLTEMQEVILFYNGLDVPTRQILDSTRCRSTKTATDAKTAFQEMAEYSQKWHNRTSRGRSTETSDGLAAIQAQLNNLGREIKKVNEKVYAAQVGYAAIRNQGASIKTLEIQIGQISKGDYGPNSGAYGASHINNKIPQKKKDPGVILTLDINNACFDNALVDLGASYTLILDMPEDIKVPLILGRPFLSTARAKIDVYKRKITLRVGEEKIIFKSVKPASSIIKRVYMLSLRERMELDLEARLMGETLKSGDDLNATIDEGKFHNSIMKDKMVYKGNNVVGALMNVPIFVGTFSIMTDFAVLEDMDAYRDEGMGDVIFGEPFLREVGIKTK
ncbi:hypothetical protein Tco_0517425 [Tanacetum coccineum]